MMVKTISERFLLPRLAAEALGVKGVEKRLHSRLTAVELEMTGVGALRTEASAKKMHLPWRRDSLRPQPANVMCWLTQLSPTVQGQRSTASMMAVHVAEGCSLVACGQPVNQT